MRSVAHHDQRGRQFLLHAAAGRATIVSPPGEVEILLVEDNPRDAELATRALAQRNLANQPPATNRTL